MIHDPEFLELTYDAALKSYWRIKALKQFLSMCGIKDTFLAGNGEKESKREVLDRVFEKLRKHENGSQVFARLAKKLSEKIEFPDLESWEDSQKKIVDAKAACLKLGKFLSKAAEKQKQEKDQVEERERASKIREQIAKRKNSLANLETRLTQLSSRLGTQQAGYDFQNWFYDLVDFYDIPSKRPFVIDGRQIDGSITVDGTTYLIELKFTSEQAGASDVDSLFSKVQTKADNTMGIMVSISGYSSVAIKEASRAKTVLLMLDHKHIFAALRETHPLPDIIGRVRRHASQTCQTYLPLEEFGGC